MSRTSPQRLRRVVLPAWLLVGDALAAFAGLSLGYWLRYATPLGHLGLDVPDATFPAYLPLLLLGVAFLIAGYAQLGLYEERLLLRKYQSLALVVKGSTLWLAGYLGLALVLKFDPPISRLFVPLAYLGVLAAMFAWRSAFHAALFHPAWRDTLRRRVALLGWNDEARALAADLTASPAHPFALAGVVLLPDDPQPPPDIPVLGTADTLTATLATARIDVLIAARTDLPRERLQPIVETCERAFVEWKIVPSSFQILVSGLRLQNVGRIPVLGVEELAINRLLNRAAKRILDLLGASIGLLLSAPLIAILALLIRRESPGASAFFPQERLGASGRRFRMWKLRSMAPDAAATDHLAQSTARDDPRLLRLGPWMRRWNLDELPQFWNVLRGDMSLVGPRPERPTHAARLAGEIPHYLPRHLVKPGMTGWAQVQGLRGDTDLARRVQHDIAYIENWSLWLDLQILALTVLRWRHPAE